MFNSKRKKNMKENPSGNDESRATRFYDHQERMAWITYVQPVVEKESQKTARMNKILQIVALGAVTYATIDLALFLANRLMDKKIRKEELELQRQANNVSH